MAKLHPEVAQAAQDGFTSKDGTPNPSLYSSVMWEAYEIGQHLAFMGLPVEGLEKSRGNQWRTRCGTVFRLNYGSSSAMRTIERVN